MKTSKGRRFKHLKGVRSRVLKGISGPDPSKDRDIRAAEDPSRVSLQVSARPIFLVARRSFLLGRSLDKSGRARRGNEVSGTQRGRSADETLICVLGLITLSSLTAVGSRGTHS